MNAVLAPVEQTVSMDDIDKVRDIYVFDNGHEDDVDQAFCFTGTSRRIPVAGQPIQPWVESLLRHIRETHPRDTDFLVSYRDTYYFRGHRIPSRTGPLIALRRIPEETPHLRDLVLPQMWAEFLMSPKLLTGGLILMVAVTGQGKSTTVSAIIRSRLEQYAGFALTIEDPIEAPLHGAHGDGVCVQTQIDNNEDPTRAYERALRGAMRSFPTITGGGTMLLVGEVRDSVTAAEVIRNAANGHLVITTIHANNIPTAIGRLRAYAAQALGDEAATDLIASTLRIAVHQTLTLRQDELGWKSGRVGGNMVWSEDNTSTLAQAVLSRKAQSLNGVIAEQDTLMRRTPKPMMSEFLSRFGSGRT